MDNSGEEHNIGNKHEPKVFIFSDSHIPQRWYSYAEFAHEFDGYELYPTNLGELANWAAKDWFSSGELSENVAFLRACLFYEARRARFVQGYPAESDMGYLDALYEKIAANLGRSTQALLE
jgi:hypothetical protein